MCTCTHNAYNAIQKHFGEKSEAKSEAPVMLLLIVQIHVTKRCDIRVETKTFDVQS